MPPHVGVEIVAVLLTPMQVKARISFPKTEGPVKETVLFAANTAPRVDPPNANDAHPLDVNKRSPIMGIIFFKAVPVELEPDESEKEHSRRQLWLGPWKSLPELPVPQYRDPSEQARKFEDIYRDRGYKLFETVESRQSLL